ncbi:MAG TPA: thioesterase family protein [Bryobacteraceae bacterium]|nr:thioesterase family protein [Bryobacteraceae bacterium]
MRPPDIPLEKVVSLDPVCLRTTVPESYKDSNGHMNVRWYLALFDDASDVLHDWMGLTAGYHQTHGTGTFDLEHHIHYLNEVMPGESVAVYVRFVAQSAKRLHYVMFLVNETRGCLAAILECMNAFADLTVRKTAPFPAEAAARIAAGIAAHAKLDWVPPVSGAMRV